MNPETTVRDKIVQLTAFCVGSADFSAHYGLRHLKPMQGWFFSVCVQLVTILAAIALFRDWTVPDWRGPVYYILAGVFHPGLFYSHVIFHEESKKVTYNTARG